MKTKLLFLQAIFTCLLSLSSSAVDVFKHQIIKSEVDELNKLGNSLKITLPGWPVSGEETVNKPEVTGIRFDEVEKVFKEKLTNGDNVYVCKYKVSAIVFEEQIFIGSFPPSLSFDQLSSFWIYNCTIPGDLPPLNFPKCLGVYMQKNKFTGSIHDMNLPVCTKIWMQSNSISGKIPEFNCPQIVNLFLHSNNFSGSIPGFDKCISLDALLLSDNKLEGEIPDFNLPSLTYLDINNNKLSGEIPNFSMMPKLMGLGLYSNQLTGHIPDFNIAKLAWLDLSNNKLEGEIPNFKLPELLYLILNNNDFSGNVPPFILPKLDSLNLKNNQLTGLPHLKTGCPNLASVLIPENKLSFEDLEPNMDIKYFTYENQDSIDQFEVVAGKKVTLTVRDKAKANKYQWMKRINGQAYVDIKGATTDSVIVDIESNAKYTCKITNTLVPGLTLYSRKGKSPSCISVGNLEFCNENGKWESAEKNELATTGLVSINDLLMFEGTITIDTTQLLVKAEGEFYIKDIPIPGGTIGKYSFCKGEYELKLMGEDGTITNFLDSKFEKMGQLFGIDLKLSKLELVGGRKASGIKMDCKIGIPGIAGSCGGDGKDTKTEIELSGIEFSTSGISMEGVAITDLGMYIKGYCLKNLNLNYDSENDILTSGAQVALPFGEIEGGIKLAKGRLDSIAWRLEATKPPFVLGSTTIGIKGFFGKISSITTPAIEVELGGIFTDITSENFYLINASGRTVWPSIFEVKGQGKFMKPPFIDKPYQVNGGVSMTYDHPLQLFTLGFNGKIGTNDEKEWLLEGQGKLKLSTKFSTPVLAGQVEGKMTLQKFDNKFPYSWLNSMFTFPVEGASESTFVWGKSHILNGTVTFQTETRGPYGLRYVIDLNKKYGEEGFLYFDTNVETKSAKLKSGNITGEVTEEITIPKNSEFAVIGIQSDTKAPVSVLTNPAGKVYNGTLKGDQVLYSTSADGKDAFWTITSPVAGKWNITLQNPAASDTIILFVQQPPIDLKISMKQSGSNVTVTWDPSLFTSSHKVFIMLDDDDSGFDGFAVAEGMANTGTISFQTSNSLSACSYNLFAQVSDEFATVQDYAEGIVNNPKSILASPVITEANYNPTIGKTTIKFESSNDINTVGYILAVTDLSGKDSTYAILNRGENSIDLLIKNYEGKTIKMTSFNADGLQGCPSASRGILFTGIGDLQRENNLSEDLMFYPNPTTGRGTIKYSLKKETYCEISITDFTGRLISQPVCANKPAGTYLQEWNFGCLPNGLYLIVLRTKESISTSKCILNR